MVAFLKPYPYFNLNRKRWQKKSNLITLLTLSSTSGGGLLKSIIPIAVLPTLRILPQFFDNSGRANVRPRTPVETYNSGGGQAFAAGHRPGPRLGDPAPAPPTNEQQLSGGFKMDALTTDAQTMFERTNSVHVNNEEFVIHNAVMTFNAAKKVLDGTTAYYDYQEYLSTISTQKKAQAVALSTVFRKLGNKVFKVGTVISVFKASVAFTEGDVDTFNKEMINISLGVLSLSTKAATGFILTSLIEGMIVLDECGVIDVKGFFIPSKTLPHQLNPFDQDKTKVKIYYREGP